MAAEMDIPGYAADPEGKTTPLDAHIRLANPRTAETRPHPHPPPAASTISRGMTAAGPARHGPLFVVLPGRSDGGVRRGPEPSERRALEEYIKPVGGGYFFTLPGVRDADDYYGRALMDAAGGPPSRISANPNG